MRSISSCVAASDNGIIEKLTSSSVYSLFSSFHSLRSASMSILLLLLFCFFCVFFFLDLLYTLLSAPRCAAFCSAICNSCFEVMVCALPAAAGVSRLAPGNGGSSRLLWGCRLRWQLSILVKNQLAATATRHENTHKHRHSTGTRTHTQTPTLTLTGGRQCDAILNICIYRERVSISFALYRLPTQRGDRGAVPIA